MLCPHYLLSVVSRGSTRKGIIRAAKGGGSAAGRLRYIERVGEYFSRLDDVWARGRAGPDLGDWQAVDRAELRKDAVVAREIVSAVPHILPLEQQIYIAQEHAERIRQRTGCAVRWALHRAGDGDSRNVHIHFLITTRPVNDKGEFAADKAVIWGRKSGGRELVADLRVDWQAVTNRALAATGSRERLDLRSFVAQGLDVEAQARVPMIEYQLARRGETHSPIYERNQLLKALRAASDACAAARTESIRIRRAIGRSRRRIRRAAGFLRLAHAAVAIACAAGRLVAAQARGKRALGDPRRGLARSPSSSPRDLLGRQLLFGGHPQPAT